MPRGELALREARIVGLYAEAKKRILGELTRVGVSSYNEVMAQEAREKVDATIKALGAAVGREAARSVRAAYVDQQRTTATQAEILGLARRGPARRRSAGLAESLGRLRRYLEEANGTIRRSADNYFAAAHVASGEVLRIREFDDDERLLFIEKAETAGKFAVGFGWNRQRLSSMLKEQLLGLVENGDLIVINGRNYDIAKYAKMVARTEIRKAQTAAAKETCAEYDCDLVEWSQHANACELCAPHEGQVFSLSGQDAEFPPLGDLEPPLHPNCLLPGNRIVSPGGFVSGIRAQYDGPAVELIFADRRRLAVTPNHLLLTPHGFAPAYLLRKGDDIFYCPDFERIVSGHPYENGMPSFIEKIVESFSETSGGTACCMKLSAEDLHGDGRFCNGDIHVIRSDRFLRDAVKPGFFKHGHKTGFDSGNPDSFLFPGEGDLHAMLKRLAFSADGIMSGSRFPSPFFFTETRIHDVRNLAERTRFNTRLFDRVSNDHPMNSEFRGNIGIEKPRFIKTDRLVDIGFFKYSSHVFDLQTPTSLYIVNGLISSNCGHSILATSREAIEARR